MPPPVSLAGTDATADAGTYMLPLTAFKAADQSVTNSVIGVNDTALVVALAANSTYEFDMELFFLPVNNSATPGLATTFTVPAGTTMIYRVIYSNAAATSALFGAATSAATVATFPGPALTIGCISFHGEVTTVGTAGNLQLLWAQANTSATSTTVKAGSFMTCRRIA